LVFIMVQQRKNVTARLRRLRVSLKLKSGTRKHKATRQFLFPRTPYLGSLHDWWWEGLLSLGDAAKYVVGKNVVTILARYGIVAVCVSDC